jgi:DNA-binding beta-propeller fold protein YncE
MGYIFVADTGNHAIRMISPHGNVTTVAGNGQQGFRNGNSVTAQFSYPTGICVRREWQQVSHLDSVDPVSYIDGRRNGTLLLFIADTGNHQIRKITIDVIDDEVSLERVITSLRVECFSGSCGKPTEEHQSRPGFVDGSGADARFDSPRGIAVSDSGNLYVADTNNHVIRLIDRFGIASTIAGTVRKSEQNFDDSRHENCKGYCIAGVQGFLDGKALLSKFSYPTAVLVTKNEEHLVVVDEHRIRKIDLQRQIVETIAGTHRHSGRDGFGLESSFSDPQGIAMTNDGYIYISDASSCLFNLLLSFLDATKS